MLNYKTLIGSSFSDGLIAISFIFLNAIKGLTALGDIFPERVIPILLENFANATMSEEVRLKLGEALLRVAKRCGETLPKYGAYTVKLFLTVAGNYFMNAFLHGTKDPRPLIRASSLSNLAELCKHMRFALHPYIADIFSCVSAVLTTEKDADVRSGTLNKNIQT